MSEAEKIIAEALVADAHADDGWLSDAQTARLSVNSDGSVSFCGEGSIDVAHAASIAVAASREAGMLTETEWEYSYAEKWVDDSGVYERQAFDTLERAEAALKSEAERVEALNDETLNPDDHVYGAIERRRVVAPGPWSPIPEGAPE